MTKNKNILITGSAGFIGFHLTRKMIKEGYKIIGYDNLNSYYNRDLKLRRLSLINDLVNKDQNNWEFIKGDLEDYESVREIFKNNKINLVINLAAQAGVRYSLENPDQYIDSNIKGFLNILECCKNFDVKKLIYASSSSVYGNNIKIPFSENDKTDKPKNIYGVTKKANELMAYTYSELYAIKAIGLRFFTVYGPWGRPDMAPMIFIKNILNKQKIKVFNNGNMSRDFTFIDDVIEVLFRLIKIFDTKNNIKYSENQYIENYHNIFNVGFGSPTKLLDFINIIEKELSIVAEKEFLDMQPGDIKETYADASSIENVIGKFPNVSLEKGIKELVNWYKEFHRFK